MGDLTQIFSSLSVGVVFVIVISTFLVTLSVPGYRWNMFIAKSKEILSKSQDTVFTSFLLTTVFIPLLYGSGLLIQDYTDYLTDRESGDIRLECSLNNLWIYGVSFSNNDSWWDIVNLSSIQRICLGDEGELRTKSLLKHKFSKLNALRNEEPHFVISLNGLGNSLKHSEINIFPEPYSEICSSTIKSFIAINDVNCLGDEEEICIY